MSPVVTFAMGAVFGAVLITAWAALVERYFGRGR